MFVKIENMKMLVHVKYFVNNDLTKLFHGSYA